MVSCSMQCLPIDGLYLFGGNGFPSLTNTARFVTPGRSPLAELKHCCRVVLRPSTETDYYDKIHYMATKSMM